MKFRLEFPRDSWVTWSGVRAQMEELIGRRLRRTERRRLEDAGLKGEQHTATHFVYEFDFELERPGEIAINLATMLEHGLCDSSKSDTASAVHTTPSSSQPTTPESKEEVHLASDQSTITLTSSGAQVLVNEFVRNGTTYIVNGYGSTLTQELSNSIGSVIYYSGSAPTIAPGIQVDAEDTSRSESNQ